MTNQQTRKDDRIKMSALTYTGFSLSCVHKAQPTFAVVWLVYVQRRTLNYSPWEEEWGLFFIATVLPRALKRSTVNWRTLPGLRFTCKTINSGRPGVCRCGAEKGSPALVTVNQTRAGNETWNWKEKKKHWWIQTNQAEAVLLACDQCVALIKI